MDTSTLIKEKNVCKTKYYRAKNMTHNFSNRKGVLKNLNKF